MATTTETTSQSKENNRYNISKMEKIYIDSGYPAFNKLKLLLRRNNISITDADIKTFLNNQVVEQLHKQTKRKHNTPIVVGTEFFTFQVDLLDVSNFSRTNKGNSWIFICIDLFTKRGSAVPQKSKKPIDSLESLRKAIEELGAIPKIIHSDDGNEWKADFDKFLKEKNVLRRINKVGDHNRLGVIDRFGKTIKNKLYKHFTATKATTWVDALPNIVRYYNDTEHTGLCEMTPNEAREFETDTRECLLSKMEASNKKYKGVAQLSVGDTVRTKLKRSTFTRGFERAWSITTYTVIEKNNFIYKLSNGEVYRQNDLLLVPANKEENKAEENRAEESKAEMEDQREAEKNNTEKLIERADPVNKARRERARKNEFKREDIKAENVIETKRERKVTQRY